MDGGGEEEGLIEMGRREERRKKGYEEGRMEGKNEKEERRREREGASETRSISQITFSRTERYSTLTNAELQAAPIHTVYI